MAHLTCVGDGLSLFNGVDLLEDYVFGALVEVE